MAERNHVSFPSDYDSASETYAAIRRPGKPSIHCEVLAGRLRMGGACWGPVEFIECRSPLVGRAAVPRCRGHRAARYKAEEPRG